MNKCAVCDKLASCYISISCLFDMIHCSHKQLLNTDILNREILNVYTLYMYCISMGLYSSLKSLFKNDKRTCWWQMYAGGFNIFIFDKRQTTYGECICGFIYVVSVAHRTVDTFDKGGFQDKWG